MKLFKTLIICAAILGVAFFIRSQRSPAPSIPAESGTASPKTAAAGEGTLAVPGGESTGPRPRANTAASTPQPPSGAAARDWFRDREGRTAALFSTQPAGLRLARIMAYLPAAAEGGEEERLLVGLIEESKAHPVETLTELEASLHRVPPEFEGERQFLVQLVAQLNVDERSKREFFRKELGRPLSPDGPAAAQKMNLAITLDHFLDFENNEARLKDALYPVFENLDSEARTILLSRLHARQPDLAADLYKRYK